MLKYRCQISTLVVKFLNEAKIWTVPLVSKFIESQPVPKPACGAEALQLPGTADQAHPVFEELHSKVLHSCGLFLGGV